MANSTISMVLGGQKKPGWDFCAAIAKALDKPPEQVFRLAGLLSPLPAGENETLHELIELAQQLPPDVQNELLDYARFKFRQQQK